MSDREWFRFQVNDDQSADIFIFGFIGDWIDDLIEDFGFGFDSVTTAKKFQAELDELPEDTKAIRLHVNSPGGDVFGAVTIANMLRDQRSSKGRTVESNVEGLAASAASIVIQAGDPIRIADNGLIMIHDPWTRAVGDARELRKAADELDKVKRSNIIATYLWNSSLSESEISDLMEATTWMDADEAVEWGFASEIVSGLEAAAALTPKDIAVLDVPDAYKERLHALVATETNPADTSLDGATNSVDGENAADAAEILRMCREAECLDLAEGLIADGATAEAAHAKIEAEKTTRAELKKRASAIRALCAKAGLDELADGYVRGTMSLADIRSHLMKITAKLGDVGIDGSIDDDTGNEAIAETWKNAFAKANRYGRRA